MKFFLAVLFFALSSVSRAQTETAPVAETKSDLNRVLENKKFEEDKAITDAKLKADAGSLSLYSLKFSLGYSGPTVDDLSKKSQPNPDGGVGVYETALRGSISFRYRFNSNEALSMGTGINALTPFHGVQRVDTNDPYISYDRTSKAGSVQMRNSFSASYVTVPNYREVGEYAGLGYDTSMIYKFGESRFSAGADASLSYYLYERAYEPKDRRAVQYTASIYPQLKYTLNDKLSFNTSVALSWWNLRQHENRNVLWNRTLSQRLGAGWAISRDIYFSPYLNFYPSRLALDSTTFNFSTVFSIL
jgi:hypothetical protein